MNYLYFQNFKLFEFGLFVSVGQPKHLLFCHSLFKIMESITKEKLPKSTHSNDSNLPINLFHFLTKIKECLFLFFHLQTCRQVGSTAISNLIFILSKKKCDTQKSIAPNFIFIKVQDAFLTSCQAFRHPCREAYGHRQHLLLLVCR